MPAFSSKKSISIVKDHHADNKNPLTTNLIPSRTQSAIRFVSFIASVKL